MLAKWMRRSLVLAMAAGTSWMTVSAVADDSIGILSVAEHVLRCQDPARVVRFYGYMTSPPLGAYSSPQLPDRKLLTEIYDQTNMGCKLVTGSAVSVSGFSADPGRDWLASVTCNGTALYRDSVARFYFGNGTATWEWTQQFGLKPKSGSTVTCTLSSPAKR